MADLIKPFGTCSVCLWTDDILDYCDAYRNKNVKGKRRNIWRAPFAGNKTSFSAVKCTIPHRLCCRKKHLLPQLCRASTNFQCTEYPSSHLGFRNIQMQHFYWTQVWSLPALVTNWLPSWVSPVGVTWMVWLWLQKMPVLLSVCVFVKLLNIKRKIDLFCAGMFYMQNRESGGAKQLQR